ncbi:MAG TPA: ABC transporter permease [Elusimicrobia bacterium]|nr:ABC transporter permease [Elusimicrobiota bacterium]
MNTTLAFIRKELVQAVRDPRMRVILFVLPILQLTVFGLALSTEVRNIRLGTEFRPDDDLARRTAERFFASGWFVPAGGAGKEPFERVRSGQADAVLVAPAGGLSRAVGRGEGRLQLLVDASNAFRARSIERYAEAVLAQGQAKAPLELDVRVLYNPAMESKVFMVPGVMSMILCLVTIILTSMSFARERELGTLETLIAAPVEDWEILLGKTAPYVLLGMVDALLVGAVAVLVFQVPMKGSWAVLFFSAFIFVCTTVSVGTLISTLASNQQQAMLGAFLFLFPAVLMSGLMFPVESMPAAIRFAAYLDPLKYFVTLLRNVMLKGGDPAAVGMNLAALVLMAVAASGLAFARFKRTL